MLINKVSLDSETIYFLFKLKFCQKMNFIKNLFANIFLYFTLSFLQTLTLKLVWNNSYIYLNFFHRRHPRVSKASPGTPRVTVQEKIFIFQIADWISADSLIFGKGIAGEGRFKNWQRGSHPCLTSYTKRLSFEVDLKTSSIHSS